MTYLDWMLINRCYQFFILRIHNFDITCSWLWIFCKCYSYLARYGFWRTDYLSGFRQKVRGLAWLNTGNNDTDVKIFIPVPTMKTTATNKIAEKFICYYLQLTYNIIILQMSKLLTQMVSNLIVELRGSSDKRSWLNSFTSKIVVNLYVRRLYNNYFNKL